MAAIPWEFCGVAVGYAPHTIDIRTELIGTIQPVRLHIQCWSPEDDGKINLRCIRLPGAIWVRV